MILSCFDVQFLSPLERFSFCFDEVFNPTTFHSLLCKICSKYPFFSEEKALSSLVDNLDYDVFVQSYVGCFQRLLGRFPSKWSGFVCVINGAPGSGKTSLILKLPTLSTVVIVPFSFLKDFYRSKGFKSFTPVSGFSSGGKCEVLVFDEFTCLCEFFIKFLILIYQPRFVVFCGDPYQCWLTPDEGVNCRDFVEKFNVNVFLKVNRRNPCSDVERVSRCLGIPQETDCVDGCSCLFMEFLPITNSLDVDFSGALTICFSHKTKDFLGSLGIDASTVRSVMGKEADHVFLIVYGVNDRRLLTVSSLRYVALTRHKKRLTVYSDLAPEDCSSLLLSPFVPNDTRCDYDVDDYPFVGSLASELIGLLDLTSSWLT